MVKFSILIANYNNGKYFKECYDSLISQTYHNWEAIIVDDTSKDNSVEIIREIIKDDNRFRLYTNEANGGCGFTKKRCVEYATGEICGYLDPDDALYPEAIEKSVAEFSKNPNIVATYSQMALCDEHLNPQKTFDNTKQVYNDRYFFNCPIQFAHFFTFKREIYLKTEGLDPSLKSAVDQDLYLKILEFGDAKFIKEVLYKYRLHSSGISQNASKQGAKESFARVIYEAMKRRNLKEINGKPVPHQYTNWENIYQLLDYQTKPAYRIMNKIKLAFKR